MRSIGLALLSLVACSTEPDTVPPSPTNGEVSACVVEAVCIRDAECRAVPLEPTCAPQLAELVCAWSPGVCDEPAQSTPGANEACIRAILEMPCGEPYPHACDTVWFGA